MNLLNEYFALGFFILFSSLGTFGANYDENNTRELKQYLSELIRTFRTTKTKPSSIELEQTIKEFIKKGADPKLTNRGENRTGGIRFVAEAGYPGLLKILLEQNVDIDEQDDSHWTSLMWVTWKGHLEAVAQLLSFGAKTEAVTFQGNTALVMAARNDHQEIVIELIGFGAEKGQTVLINSSGKTKAILSAFFSNDPELPGEPWLHHAIRCRSIELLQDIFIDSPQDSLKLVVNELDVHGFTPLDIALVTHHEKAILLLLEHGADPTKCRFNPRIIEWKKPCTSSDMPKPIYYLNFDYSRKHYFPILASLNKYQGVPFEIIKYIIKEMLLE